MIHLPKGYAYAVAAAGFKKKARPDLGLIVSETEAVCAGVFTTNLFQAAPVTACREALAARPHARALVVNSGQANACTGTLGREDCEAARAMIGRLAGVEPRDVLPSSTGVIGPRLKLDLWEAALPLLGESLGQAGPEDVAKAMMTTDTRHKLTSASVTLSGGEVRLLGMAKGAGMIGPNMATMLAFVLCDAEVDPQWWQGLLSREADRSFNAVIVDGDTSTNDTALALANGASGVRAESAADRELLALAVRDALFDLAYMLVEDAEGGTKVARIQVSGAKSDADAELVARAVGTSPLVKTALFGEDANWGRVVCAAGRSGASFDPERLTLRFGEVLVFAQGRPESGDLDALLGPVMKEPEVPILIDLGAGDGFFEVLASDLTRDYVSINADYRS
ncbi:bifunctional glutamate N-acetyltransferase/amino-acid acetyltransferase ArgJ [Paucidesulfovibrio longus]|uniref:bifunctional glutamate N-acetyltransferase/amino-acid acetyltransferase ArgJ n=1 Tax=Paucidesulfovibrio longus TaxID=889 RepID=UPI0003B33629|nr:bifunctional glutamate N-acetyltransferase/amino-acid acetyltransferase ArgJ [Paucidesulfovibrio longus]